MCGIAGYANLENKHKSIDENLLKKMQKSIEHRGPDDSGIWKSDEHQIGFSHSRLSILDLSSAGRQPMLSEDKSIVISFNGEIYNFEILKCELISLGHKLVSKTDTEIMIYAYKEWGIDFVYKLDGMFAFALFDSKKNKLFLVRDRIGIKPLYFSFQSGFVSFASEIKALFELPWIKRNFSEVAFYHYLTFMVAPAPYTIFEKIYKLPAGFYTEIDFHTKETKFCEYYSPIKNVSEKEKKYFNDENFCIENIKSLLKESTKKRMISDVPFGAFLSGGIDSSLNVALMAEQIGKVKTFTVAFSDQPENNELKWARLIAKTFDTDHHEIIISEKEAFDFYEKMIYHLDEPLADCVCIPFYHVAKLAKDSGVTVVQVGEGSDELFFGYNVYAQHQKLYKNFFRPAQKFLPKLLKDFSYLASKKVMPQRQTVVDTLYKLSHNKSLFWGGAIAFNENQKKVFCKNSFDHDEIVSKICSGLNQGYDSHNFVDYHAKKLLRKEPNASFIKRMTYLELKQRLPELLLMRADKMSMATSVEARVPFLDHKLVEFALKIPDHIKFKNNTTKYILKKACEGIIPKEIINRKKLGFSAPIVRWLNNKNYFYENFRKRNIKLEKFGLDSKNNNLYNVALQKWILAFRDFF